MKRTARTALLAAVLIMSISILPAEQVWADSDEVAGKTEEVQISGSGYIGAAPEDTSGVSPAGSGGEDDDTVATASGDVRTAAPQTGDESHAERFLLQFLLAGIIICLVISRTGDREMRKTRAV